MIMYRQSDGSGCPYLLIGHFDLSQIIEEETAKFYKEEPGQFEKSLTAKEFAPICFGMLAHRITKRVEEEKLK